MRIKQYILTNRNPLSSFRFASVLVFFICCFSQTFAFNRNPAGNKPVITFKKLQQNTITGTIISPADNLGIPGVNITIKGTTSGTVTDIDGKFSIEVDGSNTVLVFTSIGFKTQEITVGTRSVINISMETEAETLGEVVIVGYGTQKKITSTGSIETVKAEVFQDRAVTNPALLLQGQTPGLTVTRSSSRPGREGVNLQIRGATSVNGGTPLVVIDGVPTVNIESFYNMNPDDIQSITVLKDASAAIYGARAANGVILVTTKKGASGKMTVSFTSTLRVNTIGIRPPTPTMQQYATVWLEATEQDGAQANYWGWLNRDNLLKMQTGYEGIYQTAYWGNLYLGNASRYDEMFGTSYSTLQNASLSGSTDKTNYRLSFSYAEDVGALKTAYDGKQQYNIRLNHTYDVAKWFKLETGVSYLKNDISSPSTGLDAASVASDPPFFPARNPYGQWYANFNIAGNRNAVAATVDGGRENTIRDQLLLNMAATFTIHEGLTFKVTSAYNKDFYSLQNYQLTVPQYTWYGDLAPERVNPVSSIREQTRNVTYQTYGGFLNYTKTFGKHTISALAGITAELNEDKTLYGYRLGFTDNGIYDLNLGAIDQKVEATGGAGHWGLYSYVARLNYSYNDKYLFEVSGRRDGASRFDPDNRWSNYGGVQAGWVVTQENFMKAIKPLSLLKLRATYGEMGNFTGIGLYDYISGISNGSSLFGASPAQQPSSWISALSSSDRTWERVGTTDFGADFSFFEGRLFGSYDYYTKKNEGMLIGVIYPDVLGGTAPKTNSGELQVKGWEVSLGWKDQIGKLRYSISANMGDSRNKLTALEGASNIVPGLSTGSAANPHVQSYPVGSYFMYETDGLFQNEQEVADYYAAYGSGGIIPSATDATQRLRPGDTKRVDHNGNGVIDEGDVKYMGDAAPHYNYGLNLNGQYGGFDFSVFFQGILEQNVQRTGYLAYPFATLYTNQTSAYIGKTWTETNTDAEYPRMTNNVTRSKWNWANNDFALQDNRYIRLKSLVLGYTLSDLEISDFKLDRLRIYFSGNDLWELTKIKDGFDPEFGESSNSTYPYTRTWSLGLNVTF